jgi:release factor H-coupled RctB family protein
MDNITITAILFGTIKKKTFIVPRTINMTKLQQLCCNKLCAKIKTLSPDNKRYLLSDDIKLSNEEMIIYCYKKHIDLSYDDVEIKQRGKTICLFKNSYVITTAIKQLNDICKLPNMLFAFGYPDLHPGPNIPIGATFITSDVVYPNLIGSDIGCGISLTKINYNAKKINQHKRDNWAQHIINKFENIDIKLDVLPPIIEWGKGLAGVDWDLIPSDFDQNCIKLGTIGSGNHFCELHTIDTIFDDDKCKHYGLDDDKIYILAHSGSRGLGAFIQNHYMNKYKNDLGKGIMAPNIHQYLQLHNEACIWSSYNRYYITKKIMECVGIHDHDMTCISDVQHNEVVSYDNYYIHRKGALGTDNKILVIAGSRGSLSYVVEPLIDDIKYGFSIAHGAGRKWSRNTTRMKYKEFQRTGKITDITLSSMGSRVKCKNKELLIEEIEHAYKDITDVIDDMVELGMINILCTLRPFITYK